jgi:hypothetical protein
MHGEEFIIVSQGTAKIGIQLRYAYTNKNKSYNYEVFE